MPKEIYTDSDEYSDGSSYSNDDSGSSNDILDLSSSNSSKPELFTVRTDICTGDHDRIELLIRQAKTVNVINITENDKLMLFNHIIVRSEAESIEVDPWITSFFSLIRYPEVSSMLHPKLRRTIEHQPGLKDLEILISARFANVPDEIIFEMYEALPGTLVKAENHQILFLSLEKPVSKDEEKEILRVFPQFKFSAGAKMFPIHTEEIFLSLNSNRKAVFTCQVGDNTVIKGYILDKQTLEDFIEAMKKYYV